MGFKEVVKDDADGVDEEEAKKMREEATELNAVAQAKCATRAFDFHISNIEVWLACQLFDSAPVSLLTAEILGIDAVQCASHLLCGSATNWVKNTPALGETLDLAQEVIQQLKASIKNSAVIRNLTKRRPKMRKDT